MEKVVIRTLAITSAKRVVQFDILLPENYPALTGISVSSDCYKTTNVDPGTNIPIGFLRMFMSDSGDELFSDAVNADAGESVVSSLGNDFMFDTIYNTTRSYSPFQTRIDSRVTVLNGIFQDLILNKDNDHYNISIYLHFENEKT